MFTVQCSTLNFLFSCCPLFVFVVAAIDPAAAPLQAWCRAIDECGLSWKYRQVDAGEWDVLESLGDERYRNQGGGGKGRLDRGQLADKRLDMPLPWDHIDTGISKW